MDSAVHKTRASISVFPAVEVFEGAGKLRGEIGRRPDTEMKSPTKRSAAALTAAIRETSQLRGILAGGRGNASRRTLLREKIIPLPANARLLEDESAPRCCAGCGIPVDNSTLGGWSRRSALSGLLWCLSCSDLTRRVFLPFSRGGAMRARVHGGMPHKVP